MSFISLDNISFSYSDIESGQPYKNAVDGVSLNIEKGEFVALLGHNGCGKSTVAKHLNAMLLPDKGKVYVDGDDTSDENKTYDIREKVGLVPHPFSESGGRHLFCGSGTGKERASPDNRTF